MANRDVRTRRAAAPVGDQRRAVVDEGVERVEPISVPLRSALAAPIEGGDVPPAIVPMREGFQIFLDEIAPPAGEDQAATRLPAARLRPMLLAGCWWDVKSRTIPNELNLAIALLAIPFWWSIGLPLWPDAAIQVGIAAIVFGLFSIAFAIGAMGGGDVKLIGALALWLPFQALVLLLVVMSLAGG